MLKKILFFASLSIALYPHILHTAMNGGNFEIYSDDFSVSGAGIATSTLYTLSGSNGLEAVSSTDGGTYILRGGFQAAEKGILSASIDNTAIPLGTLTTTSIATGSVTLHVSTDSETGYTAALTEDGNLRTGTHEISDVTDGTVTTGTEEYGIVTSGADGLLSSDTAITNNLAIAATSGSVIDRATTVLFHAAISPTTPSGNYTHTVTFTVTVNP